MQELSRLRRRLESLDRQSYRAYKSIAGSYAAEGLDLHIDHVQGDPFAAPSRLRAVVPPQEAKLPEWTRSTPQRCVSTADFLNRALVGALRRFSGKRGSGKSGQLSALAPGQQVLARTSLEVSREGRVVARFACGLPAAGRRILGRAAAELLCDDLLDALDQALFFEAVEPEALRRHIETVEDAQTLRAQLAERDLVAFVGEGAILPRRSGADERPLSREAAVPFQAPQGLRVTLQAPHAGEVAGMGLPAGVSLIVGGGFHGKSTLLRAIEQGVYDHIPGDGREQVVTRADAVKVRAEDGRAVAGVDISGFIQGLPGGQDTRAFSTGNASGSTSQATAIVEALEVGSSCLLMDEDTSATNFMIRDARMQALIADELEPITPLIDRVRALADEAGVSTVLVVGGAGDYFEVADTVVALEAYRPREVTAAARAIAARLPSARRTGGGPWTPPAPRRPDPRSIDARRGRKDVSFKVPTLDRLVFGPGEIELAAVEQLVELAQLRAIAEAIVFAGEEGFDERRSLRDGLEQVMAFVAEEGLVALQRFPGPDLAAFRIHELAAVLGRLRTLRMKPRS